MEKNVLDWYNKRIEEISEHNGYIIDTTIYEDYVIKDFDWFIDEYSPEEYELLYIEERIEFTKNGTPLYKISIYLDKK